MLQRLTVWSWCIAVCMVSALSTSRRTSGSCPRFILASDCVRPPVPTSWFLPHAGFHLATEHSRSQELERGTCYRPVSPPHHLCPHSGDSWRHLFSSDNGVNNTNYCVMILKCFSTQHHVNLGELNWTELKLRHSHEQIGASVVHRSKFGRMPFLTPLISRTGGSWALNPRSLVESPAPLPLTHRCCRFCRRRTWKCWFCVEL